jgi:hypothetical protein
VFGRGDTPVFGDEATGVQRDAAALRETGHGSRGL